MIEEAVSGLLIFSGFAAVIVVVAYIAESRIGEQICRWLERVLWQK
jgi:hypothetical protein